ncbi:MAG: hypothetical protein JWN04_3655, partial [Myxococcaceae bacterium]|nr:hypothetical protein [Myxococcaceae bacterium]
MVRVPKEANEVAELLIEFYLE